MSLSDSVNVVRVRGYLLNQDGTVASNQSVTFVPAGVPAQYVVNVPGHGFIRLAPIKVTPDETGYFFADLVATDDPAVTPFAWSVALGSSGLSMTIRVPVDSPTVDVGSGVMKQAMWLADAATVSTPPSGPFYYTAPQVDAAIATAGDGAVADATDATKGKLKLAGDLAGTADAPTVPALASKADVDDLAAVSTVVANLAGTVSGKLTKSANLSDLPNAPTARTNLGLAAVAATGAYADLSGKPAIPAALTDLTGQVTDAQIPASIARDSEVTVAVSAAVAALVAQIVNRALILPAYIGV